MKRERKKNLIESFTKNIHHVCKRCGKLCDESNNIVEDIIPVDILETVDYTNYDPIMYCNPCIKRNEEFLDKLIDRYEDLRDAPYVGDYR